MNVVCTYYDAVERQKYSRARVPYTCCRCGTSYSSLGVIYNKLKISQAALEIDVTSHKRQPYKRQSFKAANL